MRTRTRAARNAIAGRGRGSGEDKMKRERANAEDRIIRPRAAEEGQIDDGAKESRGPKGAGEAAEEEPREMSG